MDGDAETLPNQRQADGDRADAPLSKTVVMILGMPMDSTEDTVRQIFGEKGAIKSIRDRSREGKDTKAFSVQYEDADAAAAALALHETSYQNSQLSVRPMRLRRTVGKRPRRTGPREGGAAGDGANVPKVEVKEANPRRIFVGNLRGNASQQDLIVAFGETGNVVKVDLSDNRNFAFVEFEHAEDAAAAVSDWNGKEYNGAKLRISKEEVRSGRRLPRAAGAGGAPRRANGEEGGARREGGGRREGGSRPAASNNGGEGGEGGEGRRPRRPRRSNPTRVFMAGVPADCELSVLQSKLPSIVKGSVKNQVAFVFFDSVESADAAVEQNGKDLYGSGPVRIEKSRS